MGIGTCAGKPWGQRIWRPISSVFPNSAFEVVSIFHSLKALAQSCAGSTNTSFDETVIWVDVSLSVVQARVGFLNGTDLVYGYIVFCAL